MVTLTLDPRDPQMQIWMLTGMAWIMYANTNGASYVESVALEGLPTHGEMLALLRVGRRRSK